MNPDANKKISIIVPVFNGGKTLTDCLSSLLKQNWPGYEIIVVDNNSTDNTKDIVQYFQTKHPNLLYILEKTQGRGVARNAGLAKASGEIIAMTDADCIAPPDWLEKICAPIISGRAQITSGFQEDSIKNYWTKQRQLADWDFIKQKINGDFINHLDTKNFAGEAQLLKRLKFDQTLKAYEDWDLFIRLSQENIKIFFLPDLKVLHRHDSSFLELLKTQSERGRNLSLILKKYQNDNFFKKNFKNSESAKSQSLRTFALFLPWSIWQLIINPQRATYRITADLAWKLGILQSLFKKNKS